MIYDVIVIGAGFYGLNIALHLRSKGCRNILVLEREDGPMLRASYSNQARVHGGYHYPRSLVTANRSRVNLAIFERDWSDAIDADFRKIYAIPKKCSKVTSTQFLRFSREIGAPIDLCSKKDMQIFNPMLIDSAYIVKEHAFSSIVLADMLRDALVKYEIPVKYGVDVKLISKEGNLVRVNTLHSDSGSEHDYLAKRVFSCAYSGVNQLFDFGHRLRTKVVHEVTELALMKMPDSLANYGITVMDGPFFSAMPFPSAKGCHSLSHVRYTPHFEWDDISGVSPYKVLDEYSKPTNHRLMQRDASRYVPGIAEATYVRSLFEVKTILKKNDFNDGRPILLEDVFSDGSVYVVLGGKIDNIYDILATLDGL